MDTETPTTPPADAQPAAPADLVAEFSRKVGTLEEKLNGIATYLATAAATPQPAAAKPAGGAPPTDDELWEAAKAGDKSAFDQHQKRLAARTYMEMRGVESEQQLVQGQLGALRSKYRILADPNHDLTKTAQYAYHLLVNRGRPQGDATYLDAVKTAIADRPDLVSEYMSKSARAGETARRTAAANPGATGVTYRDDAAPERVSFNVSKDEAALAQRMGVKDPAGAKKRFLERQANGKSQFGAIASAIDMEGF